MMLCCINDGMSACGLQTVIKAPHIINWAWNNCLRHIIYYMGYRKAKNSFRFKIGLKKKNLSYGEFINDEIVKEIKISKYILKPNFSKIVPI